MLILEGKIKKVALLTALDICLRKKRLSPKRCARNIVEMGSNAYPDKISEEQKKALLKELKENIENGDINKARESFISKFFD